MRKLLTLSALLLFSVDVFADDKYCGAEVYLQEGESFTLKNREVRKRIEEQCEVGDLLWIIFNVSELINIKTLTDYQGLYCNFEHEISAIRHDNGIRHLQCILTKKRTNRPIKE